MVKKTIIIYTSTDDARMKLRSATQILFTLTPAKLLENQSPIAWQLFKFFPNVEAQQSFTWSSDVGFSAITQDDNDIIRASEGKTVKPGEMLPLEKDQDNRLVWTNAVPVAGDMIAARNESGVSKSFALCAVDNSDPYFPKFQPLVHLGSLSHGKEVRSGHPVMLQAYAVAGYTVGQLLEEQHLQHCLIRNFKGNPVPIDVTELGKNSTFRVRSDHSGRVILEQQS